MVLTHESLFDTIIGYDPESDIDIEKVVVLDGEADKI